MKVTCVSAANIEMARGRSASVRTCELIRDIILEEPPPDIAVEIVPLLDYELNPCRMTGECYSTGWCERDPAFNQVFSRLIEADAIFIVCPHYAPIPSKLVMLFEKMQEMFFLHIMNDPDYIFPLNNKPVGVIGHGGQTEEALSYYKSALLDPIATVLTSVQMKVVGANEKWPYGVAFGIKDIIHHTDSIFFTFEHDWASIRTRIKPLVINVIRQANRSAQAA